MYYIYGISGPSLLIESTDSCDKLDYIVEGEDWDAPLVQAAICCSADSVYLVTMKTKG